MGQLNVVGRWQRESQRLHGQPNISGILTDGILVAFGHLRESPCQRIGLRTPLQKGEMLDFWSLSEIDFS